MPPKVKIEKEKILEEAYNIVCEQGFEKLNARDLANNLNCSVQPIFHKFENMEDLKNNVMKKILDTYHEYMFKIYNKDFNEYKNMGIGYITFAKEQPKLFHIMFMSNQSVSTKDFIKQDEKYKDILTSVENVARLDSKDEAMIFHTKIWIFKHGIATMLATRTCEFTDQQISDLLSDVYIGLNLKKEYDERNKSNEKNN